MARVSLGIGRIGGVSGVVMGLMGLVFFGAGLLALWGIGHQVYDGASTYFWQPAPCVIESSRVVPDQYSSDHLFEVTYRWTWEGREYRGDRLWPHYQGSSLTDANNFAVAYPPGRRVTCYVDPGEPSEATLEKPSVWLGLILLVPFPFLAIGVFLLWIVFPTREDDAAPAVSEPVAGPEIAGKALGCGLAFFGVFVVAGLGFFVPFFLLPAFEALDARDWREVPATVVSSQVRAHSGDDGTTYSVEVVYRYETGGRELHSDRYHFLSGSSSGYKNKAAIVERYPEGAEVTAWVDPDNPGSAVLSRDFSSEWLFGLLPLVFVFAGLGGMVLVWKGMRKVELREAAGIESWMPAEVDERSDLEAGAQILEAQFSPAGKLGLTVFFALVWNGITGAFVWGWWGTYQEGSMDGCLTLFLIPFVLIGVLLLISVPYQFLASFNPRPVLRIDRRLEPGSDATVNWHFKGRAGRVGRLRLTLLGEEKATYRQGTDTRTDTETFHQELLVDSDLVAQRGSAPLPIPEDTMHSFEAPNNEIVWTLVLHGSIRMWPDVNDRFPLVVHPREIDL